MKLNALTVTALAVTGLAVLQFARSWRATNKPSDPALVGTIFDQARAQRQASGAAVPMNTDYLRYWASPLADTIYGNGSLGD